MESTSSMNSRLNPSDSISKLQATLLKMISQVDGIASDFDRILVKSGVSDKASKLEEENLKLKNELNRYTSPAMTSSGATSGNGFIVGSPSSAAPISSPGTTKRLYGGGILKSSPIEPQGTDISKAEDTIKVCLNDLNASKI